MTGPRALIVVIVGLTTALWIYACGDETTVPTPADTPRPTTVTVSPTTAQLTALGATVQFSAIVRDQNGRTMTGASVAWASSATAVATVNSNGLATAAGNGAATITATAGGVSGAAAVTVSQEVGTVEVTPATDTLAVGDTLRLVAEATDANGHVAHEAAFSWASDDTTVAVVDATGLVTAKGPGTTTITATSGSARGTALINVVSLLPAASFVSPSQSAPEGGTAVLNVSLSKPPENAVTIRYVLSVDNDIATDDADSLDYVHGAAGTIQIAAGDTIATIEIVINDDDEIEPTREVLAVVLDPPDHADGYVLGSPASATVTIQEGVCDRTPQVRDEIMRLADTTNCRSPDGGDLEGITNLELCYRVRWSLCEQEGALITELRVGDFQGLSRLARIDLSGNALTTFPVGVFSGLEQLGTLWIADNQLSTLPDGVFAGLSRLWQLGVAGNRIAALPDSLFSGLSALEWLTLSDNPIAELPPGIFKDLPKLTGLYLTDAQLDSLPATVFVGLGNLTELDLRGNPGVPFVLTLQPVRLDNEDPLAPGPAEVAVTVAQGAPFAMRVPLATEGGDLSADTLTIGAGTDRSPSATLTRNAAGAAGTLLATGPGPPVPEYFQGIVVEVADPIVLFAPTAPAISLATRSTSAPEGGTASLDVTLSSPASAPVTFHYSIGVDDNPDSDDADASDYSDAASGTIRVAAGASSASIGIDIHDDDDIEPTREVFTVTLEPPGDDTGYIRGLLHTAAVTIEEGVCDRTPRIRDEIMAVAGTSDCAGTDDGDLARILRLDIRGEAPWERFEGSVVWTRELVARIRRGECEPGRPVAGSAAPTESVTCAGEAESAAMRQGRMPNIASGGSVTSLRAGDFAGLSNLEVLYLLRLGLEELAPGVFDGLEKLHWLSLQFNELTSLPEGVFSDLTSLWEGIILANNRLRSIPETAFSGTFPDPEKTGFPERGLLILEYNELTEVPARAFAGLTGVNWLFLNGNRLTGLPPGALSDLSRLTVLNLGQNEIGNVPDRAFAALSRLEELHLRQNQLTSVPVNAFGGQSSLRQLLLDQNLLTDLPAGAFSGLPQLTTLSLSGNPLGTLQASDFTGLPDLESLGLGFAHLTELPPELFSGLQSLTRLNLRYNLLHELPAGAFVGLTSLRELRMEGNPGAPFSLALGPRRTDSQNLLAPGPATVSVALAPGAPFNMTVPVTVHGGSGSTRAFVLEAGSVQSTEITVTRATGGAEGTQVFAGPAPRLPRGVTGIELVTTDPLILFATVSNRAPLPERQLPWLRMREGGEASRVDVSSHFRDPDGDALEYTAVPDDPGVATVSVTGSHVTVSPVGGGSVDVTVTATDPGGLSADLSLPATVRGGSAGHYDIDLILIDEVSESIQAAFDDAVDYWSAILAPTELSDVQLPEDFELGCWDITTDQRVQTVDEVVIVASVREIDGPSGILASAGPCGIRDDETHLPFMGAMQFDVDDLEWLEQEGDMAEVILHEMGHVFGLGPLWSAFGLLVNPSLEVTGSPDTHFSGPLAIAAFDEAGGVNYEGAKVPVENRAGPGSGDAHWRESVLDHELMTPYQNGGEADPLSTITIQSLADMGYKVNADLAEPFRLPGTAAAADKGDSRKIAYGDDILRGPIIVVDSNGKVVRVIPN